MFRVSVFDSYLPISFQYVIRLMEGSLGHLQATTQLSQAPTILPFMKVIRTVRGGLK